MLSDKYGKKLVYAFGMLIFSVVYFGFALLDNFVFIWILFALYGLFSASTEGVVKAWVSDIINPKYIASGIGLTTLVMSFSVMLGSILAGVLWDAFGSQFPFLISAIVSAILAVALLIWKEK
jgi:MFS family permease